MEVENASKEIKINGILYKLETKDAHYSTDSDQPDFVDLRYYPVKKIDQADQKQS